MRRSHSLGLAVATAALLAVVGTSRRPLRDARWRGDYDAQGASPRLRTMSLRRTREALGALTRNDPLRVTVGAVGRDEEGAAELHLVMHNRGRCVVRSFRGVAYGFDARGEPSNISDAHENRVVVQGDGLSLAPGGQQIIALSARVANTASLAVAHLDAVECADGTRWDRNRVSR